MTETFNYYINTGNKDRDDTNFNFNYRLSTNINLREDEQAYFKLIDFSMMNSMLNISSFKDNNKFKVDDNGTIVTITIPDGNYNVTTLRDKINELTSALPIALNYDSSQNRYYWVNNEAGIIFYPMNMKMILGFNYSSLSLIIGNNYGNQFVNLLSYTKILLTTNNLAFNPTTDNNLNRDYTSNEGINEIITWIDKDIPTFATITYENRMNIEHQITNRNITYINLSIMNEYKELIRDCPNSFIHFQIIIRKKNNVDIK